MDLSKDVEMKCKIILYLIPKNSLPRSLRLRCLELVERSKGEGGWREHLQPVSDYERS